MSFAKADWPAAMEHFEAVEAVRADLGEREPGVSHRKLELASAHTWIGKTARKSNQLDKSVRHHTASCSILKNLLDAEPGLAEYAIRLSRSQTRLGVAQMSYKTDDSDKYAIKSFQQAHERMTALQNSTGIEAREKDIVELLTSIDGNIAIVNGRLSGVEQDH